jgi:hypothetical protein
MIMITNELLIYEVVRPRRKWENNIKMNLGGSGWGGMD